MEYPRKANFEYPHCEQIHTAYKRIEKLTAEWKAANPEAAVKDAGKITPDAEDEEQFDPFHGYVFKTGPNNSN